MISDDLKGNITTVAIWIVTLLGSCFAMSELTANMLVGLISAAIVAVLNYYNMKYNNTIVEPVNAELTEDNVQDLEACSTDGITEDVESDEGDTA